MGLVRVDDRIKGTESRYRMSKLQEVFAERLKRSQGHNVVRNLDSSAGFGDLSGLEEPRT
jgi:hypothetical protein